MCFQAIDWVLVKKEQKVDESVKSVEWAQPGTVHGYEMLASFITNRIKIYNTKRNDPNVKALSNLSPWFHFGQLSVQRSVLHVKRSAGSYEAKGKVFSFKKRIVAVFKKGSKNSDFLLIISFIISFSGIAEQPADPQDEDSEDEEVCEEMS